MAYYKSCEHCGSNLDPGEKCGCQARNEEKGPLFTEEKDETGNRQQILVCCVAQKAKASRYYMAK